MEEYFSRENEDAGEMKTGALPNRDFWRESWYDTNQPTAAGVSALSLCVQNERSYIITSVDVI